MNHFRVPKCRAPKSGVQVWRGGKGQLRASFRETNGREWLSCCCGCCLRCRCRRHRHRCSLLGSSSGRMRMLVRRRFPIRVRFLSTRTPPSVREFLNSTFKISSLSSPDALKKPSQRSSKHGDLVIIFYSNTICVASRNSFHDQTSSAKTAKRQEYFCCSDFSP